jgi:hypothetical protein
MHSVKGDVVVGRESMAHNQPRFISACKRGAMAARYGGLWILGLAALASLAPRAPAQVLATEPPAGAVQVVLTALDGGPAFAAAPPSGPIINADPNLPRVFPWHIELQVGFEFLQPEFSGRAVTLTIPAGSPASFPILAGSGNVSEDFNFVPRFGLKFDFPDLGFGVRTSETLMSFSGRLQRTIDSAQGSGTLNANSSLDIANFNLIELSSLFTLERFACLQDTYLADCDLLGSIGARYSHVRQDYTASLTSGSNSTSLDAHQDYDGFGLTLALETLCPLPRNIYLYTVSRGSFLIGTNNRNTHFSANLTSGIGNSAGKVTENKTDFIPVGEFEVGLAWSTPLWPLRPSATPDKQYALLWIKSGLLADVWGNLGLLSATDGSNQFSGGSLVLFGFSVLAGIEY